MTRSALSCSPRFLFWMQAAYVVVSGTLAFGAGYGAARMLGSMAWGILVALIVTVAAGWWGHSLQQVAHRVLVSQTRRTMRGT